MTVHHEKIAKTFKSTFASFASNEIVPFAFARTRAKVAFTCETPSRCHQYCTMAFKSTETLCARKGIHLRRSGSKWIHLVTYGVHRLYLKKIQTKLYHAIYVSDLFLVGIVIELVYVQHILKGVTKHVHDVILFVERHNPSANIVDLVKGRNAILGKGDELMVIIMMHVVVRHLVLAEIQANHEKRAFFVRMRLIDKHW